MSEDRVSVPVEEALRRLVVSEDYDPGDGPQPCVHTIVKSGGMLLGANWTVTEARQYMERHGVSEAGESATASGHALAVVEPDGRAVFFAASPPKQGRTAA